MQIVQTSLHNLSITDKNTQERDFGSKLVNVVLGIFCSALFVTLVLIIIVYTCRPNCKYVRNIQGTKRKCEVGGIEVGLERRVSKKRSHVRGKGRGE